MHVLNARAHMYSLFNFIINVASVLFSYVDLLLFLINEDFLNYSQLTTWLKVQLKVEVKNLALNNLTPQIQRSLISVQMKW